MCFAVGLFAVVQHGLCKDKEVFRSGAGDAQGKLCALQRVADDLVCGFSGGRWKDLPGGSAGSCRNSSGITSLFFG